MSGGSVGYRDRWIECGPDALRIRGYYFPWGTKTIPYASIRGVRRVRMGPLTGQARIWGTGNVRYWAGLDPKRLSKTQGIVLDTGKYVHPFITPDDPAAVEDIVRERSGAVDDGAA
ncbi:hypothetical protein SAMN05216251_120135 [Actinacidiphila alni]|uniref:Bacterial Pleckstrin homology domain-containing protein n=1 Tax=Actinacidiphila alni TaxID=380248 RepID=A0A1I2JZV5_9ACTN|nr:hypothetical protein [Actinacidiphila alni]SFF59689.1 hypothetical protein SAMN05216251_120135 [Actinacidiphila alni]